MYDIKNEGHNHPDVTSPRFENVVVDARHSFLGLDPDQVVCYRESHRNFYIFTLILMASVMGLVAYGFMVKSSLSRSLRRKNGEIEAQKETIEKTNHNLISSIQYASRVQQAFLPSPDLLAELFPDHFVINQPRDIVSGDFYWAARIGPRRVLCLGDCTGHGVPGALLTMNAFNLLNQLVPMYIDWPGVLIDRLHKQLIDNLFNSQEEVQDGMDITFLVFDDETRTVDFVAAHQSIFIANSQGLTELKGERRGLGPGYKGQTDPFTVHSIPLEKGSCLYAFSDGITDQFGGPEDKKFSKRRLRQEIETHMDKPLQEQQSQLTASLAAWKGTKGQTDDILFIALRA